MALFINSERFYFMLDKFQNFRDLIKVVPLSENADTKSAPTPG